ncbi:DUF86 domain-containing protein [Pseudohoeflea suaedae]|uniref:DUF86 domain-containing protein n=1 Tax=Pseudohoeflea suaedae TaxID=877384 RepID=A0A4R5PPQ5_9HYPH|nr:HepT-like ribonuclease domain-containing protein [Pseudohoeflea suaedae]TDH39056.1 DUF86 domain-containing protein [Pseudohoeflea suaedae]
MADRTVFRLQDIVDSIDKIDALLEGNRFEDLYRDDVRRAAFERFLEILSEASKHIPENLKNEEPAVPWSQIRGIGNHLRHAYHRVDFELLWNTWQNGELAALKDAVRRMLAKISS